MKKRILNMIILGIKQFRDPYYQGFAAQLSFYFILSIVPIILLVTQIMSNVFEKNINEALGWILSMTDSRLSEDISNLIVGGGNSAISLVFIVIAFWAASRAQFSMMRITNFTITGGKTTGRGFFKDRLRAMLTMFVTLLTIVFSFIAMIYGEILLEAIFSIFGISKDLSDIWLFLRWPIAMGLYILMIGCNYYVLPTERVSVKSIIPGTIFASIGLLLVTVIYSFYASKFANYNLLYGSLASMAALMIWFYFLAWVLCLGVLFNKVWADTKTVKGE